MIIAPIPPDEEKRLADLKKYSVLDTPSEEAFDAITKLAATICEAKISLVSLIDKDRQWFKSRFGLETLETPRDISFCGHAIMSDDIFIVEDAALDKRFCDNPLFVNEPNVRFYAGVPLVTPSGSRIGTLCVIHSETKNLSTAQQEVLKALAKQVVILFELKLKNEELSYLSSQYHDVQLMTQTGGWELDVVKSHTVWSKEIYRIHEIPYGTPVSQIDAISFYLPHERARLSDLIKQCIDNLIPYDSEFEFVDALGVHKWVRSIGKPILNDEGKVTRLIGTFQDISTNKIAQLKLIKQNSEKEAYARGLNKYAKVSRTDLKGNITHVNELFCTISGYQRDEVIGCNYRLMDSGYHPKSFFKELWDTINKGLVWRGEIKNKAKDGHFYWVDTTIAPIMDSSGNILEFVSFKFDITERKKIENQLIEAQAISKVGSWSLNLITKEQLWSQEHYKIFEIDSPQPQHLLYQLYRDRIHPGDHAALDKVMNEAMNEGKDFIFDHRVYLDDGKRIKFVQGIGKVETDADGRAIFISGTCRDRTLDVERDSKYQNLITSMGEGFVLQGADGRIVHFNNSALEILELTSEQIMGKSSVDPSWKAVKPNGEVFPGEEHPAMMTLRTGLPYSKVMMGLKFPENKMKWISINTIPVNEEGAIKVLSTFSDITELVSAQEEIRFILDTIGIGVWKFYPQTQKLEWDNSMYRLFNMDPNSFTGHYEAWESSLSIDGRAQAVSALENALSGKKEFNHTFEIISDKEKKQFIGGKAKVKRDEHGKAIVMYGINWDRSIEIELEENLEAERTRSAHNARLASIGQLAAGVGHEINNPLAIILGNITISEDLLMDSGIPHERITERFTKMKNAIQRIANIVKSLRTFARSDNNLVSLFDPCALAEETVEMLKELYIKEDVTLSFSGVKQPFMLNGNKGRIQQVMINLITNAKDATIGKAKRNVDVFVSFESNEVKVVVADNGCGVPDHLKEKIFSPFFTTKEVNEGTGIGLALVNATIKEHHGRLELQTKLDVGSKFIFTIPVVMDLNQPQVTRPLVSTQAKLSKIECTVMLVDDEPELRDVFQIMLSKICRNVIVAESAEAGLKLLQKESVDLIISDIKMSGLDGFEFLKLVRLNETISQPRFMFITGGIEISREEQLIIAKQTDGVLNKPISEEDVYKKLSELFTKQKT